MTSYRDPGSEPGGANTDLFGGPADFIAPGLEPYRSNPPVADGRKVVILDTDHIGGGDAQWVWKTFARGMNPIYMDTWKASEDKLEETRKALGQVVICGPRIDLSAMIPHNELASSGYCLANLGQEYLLFLPESGRVTVDLSAGSGTMEVEWIHPIDGTIYRAEAVAGGNGAEFRAPFKGSAVLHVHKRQAKKRAG